MKIEIRNNGIKDITVILADEGKVFKRKNTDDIYGDEMWLGYSYYIGGIKQDPPHLDTPEDFEEIDNPNDTSPEEALQIITGQ